MWKMPEAVKSKYRYSGGYRVWFWLQLLPLLIMAWWLWQPMSFCKIKQIRIEYIIIFSYRLKECVISWHRVLIAPMGKVCFGYLSSWLAGYMHSENRNYRLFSYLARHVMWPMRLIYYLYRWKWWKKLLVVGLWQAYHSPTEPVKQKAENDRTRAY